MFVVFVIIGINGKMMMICMIGLFVECVGKCVVIVGNIGLMLLDMLIEVLEKELDLVLVEMFVEVIVDVIEDVLVEVVELIELLDLLEDDVFLFIDLFLLCGLVFEMLFEVWVLEFFSF